MSETQTITLGGKHFDVREFNFGQLRRLLPAINRAAPALARNVITEAVMDDLGLIVAAGTGLSVAEVDALPLQADELTQAFSTIVTVAGLVPREGLAAGEASAVAAGTGTNSMPTSSPVPDGAGPTSTI